MRLVLIACVLSACTTDTVVDSGEPGLCGDGVVDIDEACDDGNTDPNDGCSRACTREKAVTVRWEFYYSLYAPDHYGCPYNVTDIALVTDDGNFAKHACAGGQGIVYTRGDTALISARDGETRTSMPVVARDGIATVKFYDDAGYVRVHWTMGQPCTEPHLLTLTAGGASTFHSIPCTANQAGSDYAGPILAGTYEVAFRTSRGTVSSANVTIDPNAPTELAFTTP